MLVRLKEVPVSVRDGWATGHPHAGQQQQASNGKENCKLLLLLAVCGRAALCSAPVPFAEEQPDPEIEHMRLPGTSYTPGFFFKHIFCVHGEKKKHNVVVNTTVPEKKGLVTNKQWTFNAPQRWLQKQCPPSDKCATDNFLPNESTASLKNLSNSFFQTKGRQSPEYMPQKNGRSARLHAPPAVCGPLACSLQRGAPHLIKS